MNFWTFFNDHWALAFWAILIGGGIATTAINGIRLVISRIFRCINIAIRGWPPAHLDADGDWMKDKS
jgi:hypothetical protein